METYNNLNPKQQKFIDNYIKHYNASKAYKEAGYNAKQPRINASMLLTKLNIKKAITERLTDLKQSKELNRDDIVSFWKKVIENEEEKTGNRLRASEFGAKMLQLWDDTPRVNVFQTLKAEEWEGIEHEDGDLIEMEEAGGMYCEAGSMKQGNSDGEQGIIDHEVGGTDPDS